MLTFRGVPVIPRFDADTDKKMRVLWAGVHGLTMRLADGGAQERELIEALETRIHAAGYVGRVERTAEGIEVSVHPTSPKIS